MNARTAMTEYRLSSWVKMVQDRDSSGLSIKEYSENIGIAPHVYYYRLKKVREAACGELTRVLNIPLRVDTHTAEFLTPLSHKINSQTVNFMRQGC